MKKPSFPRSVQIGGKQVKIKFSDEDPANWGTYCQATKVITLCGSLRADRPNLKATLFHEMLHAAFDISGVRHSKRFDEEVVVSCLEEMFYPAWKRVCDRHFKNS